MDQASYDKVKKDSDDRVKLTAWDCIKILFPLFAIAAVYLYKGVFI